MPDPDIVARDAPQPSSYSATVRWIMFGIAAFVGNVGGWGFWYSVWRAVYGQPRKKFVAGSLGGVGLHWPKKQLRGATRTDAPYF